MPSLQNLFEVVKSRKLIRTLTIYASSSFTALGAINLFLRQYSLPTKIFDVLLVSLLCGLPAALIRTWYRATGEKQTIPKKEIAAYSLFFVIAAAMSVRIIITPSKLKYSPEEKSVAVLPFKNFSDSKEDEYFSDGVTEDIITQISKVGDLTVISRTSIMPYKNTQKTLREIGKELNVAAILEGSVRRDRNRVRIVGQLINALNDKHIWAETYDREITDIFAIQSEVAQEIASELKAKLSPEEKQRIEKKATGNVEAYAYYLRGRDYYYRYTREDNEKAVGLFKKAIELDPNYALAYAGLGDAYAMRVNNYGYPEEYLDLAMEMSNEAISIDSNLAEGYKALGLAQESKGDVKKGLESYYKAIQLNPNLASAITNIGLINFNLGRYDEALRRWRKAVELQPGFARYYSSVALGYLYLGYDNLASAWCDRALEFQLDAIFPQLILSSLDLFTGNLRSTRERIAKILSKNPEERRALETAGDVELLSRKFQEAWKYYDKLYKLTSTTIGPQGNKLAYVLLKIGDRETASKVLSTNLSAYLENPELQTEGSPVPYCIAEVYSMQGKKTEALEWLKKAVDQGFSDRWFFIDPLLEDIRNESQFKPILADLQKKLDEMRKRVREWGLDR
jgi:TolB-like protein/Tfp pilus assembly protein PilF